MRRPVQTRYVRRESGAVGWMFLWLLGVPASVLLVLFVLRGCT